VSWTLFNLLWTGALIGGLQGVTGAGGGIMAVPALVAVLGWGVVQAGPVALIGVAGSAALGGTAMMPPPAPVTPCRPPISAPVHSRLNSVQLTAH
jgi:hypothetical protein